MDTQQSTKPFVIGLDLGGTNAVFGIVDQEGSVKATTSIKTQAYDTAYDFVDASVEAIGSIADQVGGISQIAAMGIGAPNSNFYRGTIERAPNIAWAKDVVPLADMLGKRLDMPVGLTNDAKAAAIGEMTYGVARGMQNFIMITLGTGVGSGIVINGQLVYGCDGFAGELGHTIINFNDTRQCGCGRKGCLEAYCSATGVARTAREVLSLTDRPSTLRNISLADITSRDVGVAAAEGDELAREILQYTGKLLGQACANFTNFCSPEAYIFFGGLANAGDLLIKPLRTAYDNCVLPIYRGKAQFLQSSLDGAQAAVLGASAIGWDAARRA